MNLIKELSQFNTPEIADALDACGIEGALLGIKPVTTGVKLVGTAFTVKYLPYEQKQNAFKNAGNYIDEVSPNSVIVIDNQGSNDCTTWGAILTQVAQLKSIAGTVIYGAARDIDFIREVKYPLFSSFVYMRSGKNRVYKAAQQCELNINGVKINPNDIVMGDDNGVVIVPRTHLLEIIQKSTNIRQTENAIMTAVKSGMNLEVAREKYRYDQPWLIPNT